jgi:hypothetical protein
MVLWAWYQWREWVAVIHFINADRSPSALGPVENVIYNIPFGDVF